MLQLWDEMASWDLLAAALVEIVDEATQADANSQEQFGTNAMIEISRKN